MYVIYGLDTKSIEDAQQCVLIDVPESITTEEQDNWLEWYGEEGFAIANIINIVDVVKQSKV